MEKQKVLEEIRRLSKEGLLGKEEVLRAMEDGSKGVSVASTDESRAVSITDILYYLGGGIAFVGIVIFVGQNWESLGTPLRIGVTLGCGLAAYISGVLLYTKERWTGVATGMHLLAALLIPMGMYITLAELEVQPTFGIHVLVALALFLFYLATAFLYRRNMLVFFSIFFGTWFYFAYTSYLADGLYIFEDAWRFTAYQVLIAGASYLALSHGFRAKSAQALCGVLNFFGVPMVLGSALALGGWTPEQSIFWEVIYSGLALGAIFLSIYLKSRAYLVFGTLFLMGYIGKITGEYFSESIGWPLSLVIIGFAFIGVGYLSFSLNKKYLQGKN